MIEFNKPENLNGLELRNELRLAGVEISDERKAVHVVENDILLLHIKQSDATKAAEVVAAHNGTIIYHQPSIEEKLASVGLTVDELKAALGL